MKRALVVLSVLIIAFSLALSFQPARADSPTWTVSSLNTTGCNSGNIGFTTVVAGISSFPTTLHFRTQVDAGGIRYMDEDAGTPGGNGNYSWHLYFSNSGGPATNAWPIPADTPITVHFSLTQGPGGPAVFSNTIVLSKCNGGSIISGGSGSAVPEIPGNFVLRTITCTEAVYDLPGGSPVGSNEITAGQTWYVSPTPVKDAKGNLWTAVFVGGFQNGYIRSVCVG